MPDRSTIRWSRDADGVVVLTLDDPGQAANTMNAACVASLAAAVARLEAERERIAGVVLTSAKPTFFAGGDLRELLAIDATRRAEIAAATRHVNALLRRLERLGRPTVSAIAGAALGGGLELVLATHHRIAVARPEAVVGLPEVTLGLLPAGGGVVRTVRLLGVLPALTDVLLPGARHAPDAALRIGLVDRLVAGDDALVPAAKAWIRAHPGAVQPWDGAGWRLPGGVPDAAGLERALAGLPAAVRRRLDDPDDPAPRAIVAAAVDGAGAGFEAAGEIELRHFLDLVTGQVAKNMIEGFFFDRQAVRATGRRPGGAFAARLRAAQARELAELRRERGTSASQASERLLFAQALEAIRCLEEGLVASSAEANVASLGVDGFPPWTGGALRFAERYAGGPAGFAARARELAERHGPRFAPPRGPRFLAA